jgi:thioredoxin-related protein
MFLKKNMLQNSRWRQVITKQMVIIGIIILLISVGLSGCTSNPLDTEKHKFIGTWTNSTISVNRTIILFSNGSCSFSTLTGIWDLRQGKFVMEFPDSHLTYTFNYAFSNNDRTLSLSSAVTTSTTQVFTKQ